jgi:hypothetical protein
MERLGDVIRQAGRCDPETIMITHEIAGTVRRFAQSLS